MLCMRFLIICCLFGGGPLVVNLYCGCIVVFMLV